MAVTEEDLRKLAGGLDRGMRKLVSSIGDSRLRWDLVRFYGSNPFALHTAGSLAVFTGRKHADVADQVEFLVQCGILERISQGEDHPPIYAYEPSPAFREAVEKLLLLFSGREESLPKLHSVLPESR